MSISPSSAGIGGGSEPFTAHVTHDFVKRGDVIRDANLKIEQAWTLIGRPICRAEAWPVPR